MLLPALLSSSEQGAGGTRQEPGTCQSPGTPSRPQLQRHICQGGRKNRRNFQSCFYFSQLLGLLKACICRQPSPCIPCACLPRHASSCWPPRWHLNAEVRRGALPSSCTFSWTGIPCHLCRKSGTSHTPPIPLPQCPHEIFWTLPID